MTVRKKVHISIISRRLISETASSNPAIRGDIRYLALPASPTIPLAFVYSSLSRRSVIVALYAGSSRAENMELTVTPMHI